MKYTLSSAKATLPMVVVVGVFALFGALFIAPDAADAATNLNHAKVNGSSSTVVEPNEQVNVWVKVTTTQSGSRNNWKSTRYRVEGSTWKCVNTPNHTSSGTYTETFKINAPGTPGTYDLQLKAFRGENCRGGSSNELKLRNAIIVKKPIPATIHASKVVCDVEYNAQHPNWGLPNWGDGGPKITATTAQDYVDNSEGHCELVDWRFQWAPKGTGNPGDNTGPAGGPWKTFSDSVQVAPADQIWLREVWHSDYIPFSSDTTRPRNDVSAEFYCGVDVLNYDNYDWIRNLQSGKDYYCVGFNAVNHGKILVNKFEDLNMDGKRNWGENAEPDLADWTFRLYEKNGPQVGIDQTTGPNGWTTFKNLMPGDYTVCEDMPAGWTSNDANIYHKGGNEYCKDVTVNPGETVKNFRFGNYMMPGSITGRKYYDVNANGDFDQVEKDEPGDPNRLNDWRIMLFDDTWTEAQPFHATGETGQKGQYRFTGVEPGTYYVCEANRTHDGWHQTEPASGEMYDGLYCHTVNVGPGEDVTGVQFGNYQSFDLHGYKWHDVNGNGYRDCAFEGDFGITTQQRVEVRRLCEEYSEELLGDWVINLYEGRSTTPLMTTTTMNTGEHFGWYWFEGLPAGNYRVCEELQDGWQQTYPMFQNCHYITLPNNNPLGFAVTLNAVPNPEPEYNFGNRLAPDLTIEKSVLVNGQESDIANEGDTLTYSITVSNNGDADEYQFFLKDTVPSNTTLVPNWGGDLPDPEADDQEITWGPFDLLGHSSFTVTFDVTVNADLPVGETTIENVATLWQLIEEELQEEPVHQLEVGPTAVLNKILGVSTVHAQAAPTSPQLVLITSSNLVLTTVTTPEPEEPVQTPVVLGEEALPALTVSKTVDAAFANPGSLVNYTIVVTNTGDALAEGVTVVDTLPEGLMYTDTAAMDHSWLLGDIFQGESKSVTYEVQIKGDAAEGIYTNTAVAWAAGVANVNDTADLEVRAGAVLGAETLPVTGTGIATLVISAVAGLAAVGFNNRKRK